MKNKGFTLIELLATILVLGIISLIAIPTVNNIIKESRKKALVASSNNIDRAVDNMCNIELMMGRQITKHYIINKGLSSPEIEVKGKLPDGDIYVDEDCNITYNLNDGNNVINKTNNTTSIEECNGPCNNYKEADLNGADPILANNLIPVIIDDNGTVKKADLKSSWYNYKEKKWANSVIVNNDIYNNSDSNTLIREDDIVAYFVWIPRYRYKISDYNNPSSINIVFENSNTKKSNSDYHTHPAFTFGKDEVDGIWIGKFETTGTAYKPEILPNSVSLRGLSVSESFATSLKMKDNKVAFDSHMMKNSEYAAVVYLSHSNYGIDKEIRINNNDIVTTGCGSSTENGSRTNLCEITYGTVKSYPQSSTGLIGGVFDLVGGSWDRVMANYNNNLASSGFTVMPDSKYYDLYTTIDEQTACNGPCYGQGLFETKGWYNDKYFFPTENYPFQARGGNYEDEEDAGGFYSIHSIGNNYSPNGFRIVLTP